LGTIQIVFLNSVNKKKTSLELGVEFQ